MKVITVLFLSLISFASANLYASESMSAASEDKIECGGGLIPFMCGGRLDCAIPPVKCCWGVACGDGGQCTSNPRSPCRWANKTYEEHKQPVYDEDAKCSCELYGGSLIEQHTHGVGSLTCNCNVYWGQCVTDPSKPCRYHWIDHGTCAK